MNTDKTMQEVWEWKRKSSEEISGFNYSRLVKHYADKEKSLEKKFGIKLRLKRISKSDFSSHPSIKS